MFSMVKMQAVTSQRFFSSVATARVPDRARVVVVGGGIIGNSVAYHLGKRGWGSDVVLLERDKLTSGTTWHAAGLMVTFGSLSETSTAMRTYSKEMYASILEQETGQSTGFKPCGYMAVASSPHYLEEFRRVAAFNRYHGVDVQEITPLQVAEMWPLAVTDDLLAGFYVPTDGRVNPVDATRALNKGAKQHGVRTIDGCCVTEVTHKNGAVTGVLTDSGERIASDVVVNCTGMWARQTMEACGVSVPNQAAEHYYFITSPFEGADPELPVLEDPERCAYIRPETNGGVMVGLFEPDAMPWHVDRVPDDFSFGEIQPDVERMWPHLERAMERVPALQEAGISKIFCGPESFTPDLAPIVGESANLDGYFVAAGLNSIGILTGPGIGRALADWIVDGRPKVDVTAIHPARFSRSDATPRFRADRVTEVLGRVYACHYPNHHAESARHVKHSPLHERLDEAGAFFKPVSGYEAPDWYAAKDLTGYQQSRTPGPYSWGRESWFPNWKREHDAVRNGVGFIDMSFMAKFLVQGRDAGAALNFLSTANVDADEGRITYTQWLDNDGTVQADVTIAKMEHGEGFLVVATDTMNGRVEGYLRRQLRAWPNAFATNITGGMAQINLQGPLSRQFLQPLTSADLSNEKFPFRSFKHIDLGYADVQCARITYVGELGYELFVPTEQARHVYDFLLNEGAGELGMEHVGLKALNSLRMEKANRDFGHDIDNLDALHSVGLAFTADWTKPKGFKGQAAAEKIKEEAEQHGLKSRLVQVLLQDPEEMLYHGEVLCKDGAPLGIVRSASYGHTLGGAVGLAMLEADEPVNNTFLKNGQWTVQVTDKHIPAKVSLRPLYDPKNERIKA